MGRLAMGKEPALILAVAAAVLVLGVDLLGVSDTVGQLMELAAVLGITGFGTRSKVTPWEAPDA